MVEEWKRHLNRKIWRRTTDGILASSVYGVASTVRITQSFILSSLEISKDRHHDATSVRFPYAFGYRQCIRTTDWYVRIILLVWHVK